MTDWAGENFKKRKLMKGTSTKKISIIEVNEFFLN